MKTKKNKYSDYDWKIPAGLFCVIMVISVLAIFFLGFPTLFSNHLNFTLLVKWDSSKHIKVSDPKLYFWLIDSEGQWKEAIKEGVPPPKKTVCNTDG